MLTKDHTLQKCGSLVIDLIFHHGGEEFKSSYLQPKLNCLGHLSRPMLAYVA